MPIRGLKEVAAGGPVRPRGPPPGQEKADGKADGKAAGADAEDAGSVRRPKPAAKGQDDKPAAKRQSQKSEKEVEMEAWTKERLWLYQLFRQQRYDMMMGLIIIFNIALMLVEANLRAECYPEQCSQTSLTWANRGLLAVYTVEAMARGYVDQSKYFHDRWNILDFTIVCFGYFDEFVEAILTNAIPNSKMLPMLRILRIARLMRAVRLLRFWPELYVMVRGFFGAMKAMFWGFVLISVLIILWSLICVELVHPVNMDMIAKYPDNDGCAEAFSSIRHASMHLFQTLVAADSWGECTMPLIEYQFATFFIFTGALISVSLGFMNLILAVIVDHAAAARDEDKEERANEKKKQEAEALEQWKEVIKVIDADQDGKITVEELVEGYELEEVHDTLAIMGIDKTDLLNMFALMDEDGSGDLDYDEFIDHIIKAQGQDLRIYLMMTRLQCDHMAKSIRRIQGGLAASGIQTSPRMPPSPAANAQGGRNRKLAQLGVPLPPMSPVTMDMQQDIKRLHGQIQEQFDTLQLDLELNGNAEVAPQASPFGARGSWNTEVGSTDDLWQGGALPPMPHQSESRSPSKEFSPAKRRQGSKGSARSGSGYGAAPPAEPQSNRGPEVAAMKWANEAVESAPTSPTSPYRQAPADWEQANGYSKNYEKLPEDVPGARWS